MVNNAYAFTNIVIKNIIIINRIVTSGGHL